MGSPRNDGAAFVFTRSGSVWSRQGPRLAGSRENLREGCGEELGEDAGCGFGISLAVSEDGNTALIGSPREKRPCPSKAEPFRECIEQGAAWVFTRSGATWSSEAVLIGGEEEGASGRFGRGVALSAPRIPYVSCVTGEWIRPEQATSPDYWARRSELAGIAIDADACLDRACRASGGNIGGDSCDKATLPSSTRDSLATCAVPSIDVQGKATATT